MIFIKPEMVKPILFFKSSLMFVNLKSMEKSNVIKKSLNSKGASIFKKMLDDKKAIQLHLKKGGKLEDLKNKYSFVKPLSTPGN